MNLSGCDALTRALDLAAGDAAALSGTEPLLIERIDSEYARYFTPTGRPTGEWTRRSKRWRPPTPKSSECAAAVAEVDDRVQRHAALTVELAELAQRQQAASAQADRRPSRRRRHRAVDRTGAGSRADRRGRDRDQHRVDRRPRRAGAAAYRKRFARSRSRRAGAEAREAGEAHAIARDVTVEADAAVERADQALVAAQQRAETARRARRRCWPVATRPSAWPPGSPESMPHCATGTR